MLSCERKTEDESADDEKQFHAAAKMLQNSRHAVPDGEELRLDKDVIEHHGNDGDET